MLYKNLKTGNSLLLKAILRKKTQLFCSLTDYLSKCLVDWLINNILMQMDLGPKEQFFKCGSCWIQVSREAGLGQG